MSTTPEYTPVMYRAEFDIACPAGTLGGLEKEDQINHVLSVFPDIEQDMREVGSEAKEFGDVRGPYVAIEPTSGASDDGREHYTVVLSLAWRASTLEQVRERAARLGLRMTLGQWLFIWTSPQGRQCDELIPTSRR